MFRDLNMVFYAENKEVKTMKLNKETLKQTVKKGYEKGKTFISEHSEDIKDTASILATELAIAGVYYIIGRSKGYNKGLYKGYKLGRQDQMRIEDEWIDGMDTETYNTVVEYDKKRHNPRLTCNQK